MDYLPKQRKSLFRRLMPGWIRGWMVAAAPVVVLASGGAWWGWSALGAARAGQEHTFVPVTRGDLDLTISAAGRLEAVSNVDIINPVAGRARIIEIVEEGKQVKKDDAICRLDATEWEQKVEAATIAVEGAEGEVTWATEQLAIQKSENASKLESAEVDKRLAQLSYDEYMLGELAQLKSKAERAVEMAQIAVAKAQEEYQLAKVLNVQGFMTATELKEKHHEYVKAMGDLEEKKSDREVLLTYKHEKKRVELEDKLNQATNKLERTLAETQSALTQKQSDLQAKQQKLTVHRQQLDSSRTQLEACTIKAPADGMVVYGSSGRYWDPNQRMTVGTEVYQGQPLFRLPDTSRMKAVVPVSEHKVAQVRVDEANPVTASVEVAGLKERFDGKVTTKSVLPSNEMPWLGTDQKSYPVDVLLFQTPPEVKPGTSVQVTLKLRTLRNVLMIPTNCVYQRDGQAYVFLRETRPGGVAELAPRPVEIGEASQTQCEVKSGLAEGEMVLALEVGQAGALLERAGIKLDMPARTGDETRPEDPAKPTAAPAEAAPVTVVEQGQQP